MLSGFRFTTTKRRALRAALIATLLISGCATVEGRRGMETFGRGVVNLVLSPFMIVAGLAQGLVFLPYTIGTGLDQLNRGLLEANAVSLDDSYRATYGVSIQDPRVDQRTGEVAGENFGFGRHRPEAMLEATRAFQRLLVSQGMSQAKAQHYVLLGDYSQVRTRGQMLLAVAHRETGNQPFRVQAKSTGIVTTFRSEHQGWSRPYERDIEGRPIDEIIDWTAIEYAALRQDKVVATLMVIAAESAKSGKRSPDYWAAERRWDEGDTASVLAESQAKVKRALDAAS